MSGEVLLLEDVVASHLAAGDRGIVEIVGGSLSGKTTAMEYIDGIFADERHLLLMDDHAGLRSRPASGRGITLLARSSELVKSIARYQLAPWGRDEWIEYLLAAHKSKCGSVIARLGKSADASLLEGNPCLWRIVLDELAADESLQSSSDALSRHVDQYLSSTVLRDAVRRFALVAEAPVGDELDQESRILATFEIDRSLLRLLRLKPVRTILAVQAVVSDLQDSVDLFCLRRQLPYELVCEASKVVKADESLQQKLRDLLVGRDKSVQPMAASLLHAAGVDWRPERQARTLIPLMLTKLSSLPALGRAYLEKANWPGCDLRGAWLAGAQMTRANLENANLDGANLNSANLADAKLHGASLAKLLAQAAVFARADLSFVRASNADLSQSNLEGVNLEGALLSGVSFEDGRLTAAHFARANLSCAKLTRAEIEGADFTQANLEGAWLKGLNLQIACFEFAIFAGAMMVECNLEGMELLGANFRGAELRRALLTSSEMRNANFFAADLRDTGLADVEWEGVDLRFSDLRGASFHLGSTRSGLVGSPYPSHGTRTGFYTDDYGDQDFKAPEEIRKANLRGADLRGAKIEGVDFYLVDVRDAIYDTQQETHLRRCGAILETRAL
jgi:uncharacterized protein YjbI with pentapeptide repeats